MNNKGFTLVELLAVLVILSLISLTTVFGISASLDRRDIRECEEEIEFAKNSAKIYFSLEGKGLSEVTVLVLKENNYLDEKKTTKIKNEDKITVSNGKYIFSGTVCDKLGNK